MGLRYLGNINKPGYNPLASNITTGVNVVQYQGIFTTQQQLQAITTGQWVTDPVFDYSTLLLQADSIANGSQNNTFLDSSTNNFTITRNGNTTQGAFSPFSLQPGEWSNYFPGSASISFSASSGFDINTYDCFECWVNLSVLGTNIVIAGKESNFWIAYNNTNINGAANKFVFAIYNGSSWQAVSSNTTPVVGTWYHVAGIRDSGTLRLYINGVQENTGTFTGTPVNSSFAFSVGAYAGNVDSMTGYVSNVRLVTGATAAVLPYTANFTPSPRPLTAVTGTQILTCQGSRFFDANTQTTAKTLGTITSTPSVQAFSPFAPQFQYTASGTGGSGYFDGTGDYLTAADNTAFEFGSGDFTIEAWVYVTATPGASGATIASKNSEFNFVVQQNLRGFFSFFTPSQTDLSGTTAIGLNNWAHFAVSRSGSNFALFVNGAREATSSAGGTISATANNLFVGDWSSGGRTLTGYMAGLRLVKGTAVYSPSSTTITVPTAPPTAIANTSLLLNYTNAGILDGTMKNNLETVGNASVSTSVVKYGSGSMYFDGSGDALIDYDPSYLNSPGSGDWTFETWVYLNALPGAFTALYHLKNDTSTATTVFIVEVTSAGRLNVSTGTALIAEGTSGLITAGSWIHVAVTRSAGTIRTFINGVQDKSASNTTTYNGTYDFFGVWRYGGSDNYLNGYMDDLRITKGIARYTQNFIPPSVALPRQ